MKANAGHSWGVILAGGQGIRLQEFTKALYGANRPKQFCTFTGTRSMFRHTVDRTRLLIPSERTLSLICREHLPHAMGQLNDIDANNILLLSHCRETAASILYSLFVVFRRDPDAMVALFPSDHFVREEQQFIDHVARAFQVLHRFPADLVILGVDAGYPETEYGWIELADRVEWEQETAVFRVKRFWEKPHEELASALLSRKCLWNTLVTLGTVRTFLELFRLHLPQLFAPFYKIIELFDSPREASAVESVFRDITPINFSSGLLQQIPHRLNVMQVQGVQWNDWGNHNRILGDVKRMNLRDEVLKNGLGAKTPASAQSV